MALGEGASRFKRGDAVTALVAGGGGHAEYAVVAETNALPVPAGLSLIEAAAIPGDLLHGVDRTSSIAAA